MPIVSIPVTEDTFARLTAWAESQHQTLEAAIVPVLDRLVPETTPTNERQRAFEELTRLIRSRADRYPSGFQVDASRESIYEGCGE